MSSTRSPKEKAAKQKRKVEAKAKASKEIAGYATNLDTVKGTVQRTPTKEKEPKARARARAKENR